MDLERKDRLMLLMLCDIGKTVGAKGYKWDLISDAVLNGDDWVFDYEYGELFPKRVRSNNDVSETVSILDMWDMIESSIERLDPAEKLKVETTGGRTPQFRGFDANNDDHYYITETFVEQMGRFKRFKGRYLNSHSQSTLPRYREMLSKFEKLRPTLEDGTVSAEQINHVASG